MVDKRVSHLLALAEKNSSLKLSELRTKLEFSTMDELEEFLIDAITNKTVNGKIDEKNDTFTVTSFNYEHFDKQHFNILKVRLTALLANFKQTHEHIKQTNKDLEDVHANEGKFESKSET